METFIPRRGVFRYLNPVRTTTHLLDICYVHLTDISPSSVYAMQFPFNKKVNTFNSA